MEDRIYPSLPQGFGTNLKAIERLMEFDPGYLSDEKCLYPPEVKAFLRRLVGPAQSGREDLTNVVFKPGQSGEEEADSLIGEIQNAINSMRRLQAEMEGDTVELQDKLNFLKSYGSLIDRFIALKEKAYGIKQMYEFQRLVIGAMEQVLDKDERLKFKEMLRKSNLVVD